MSNQLASTFKLAICLAINALTYFRNIAVMGSFECKAVNKNQDNQILVPFTIATHFLVALIEKMKHFFVQPEKQSTKIKRDFSGLPVGFMFL